MKALAIIAALLIAVLPVRGDGEALLSAVYGAWSQSAGGGARSLPEWMPSDCAAWYPMTDATPEFCYDWSENESHGTQTNSSWRVTVNESGYLECGAGIDGYFMPGPNTTNAWSMLTWVWCDPTSPANIYMFHTYIYGAKWAKWGYYAFDGEAPSAQRLSFDGNDWWDVSPVYSRWVLFGMCWDGSRGLMSVNNAGWALWDSGGDGDVPMNSGTTWFLGFPSGATGWKGKIGPCVIFDRETTAGENALFYTNSIADFPYLGE